MSDARTAERHEHSADDITQGYIRPSLTHLRASAERVGEFLVARAGVG